MYALVPYPQPAAEAIRESPPNHEMAVAS